MRDVPVPVGVSLVAGVVFRVGGEFDGRVGVTTRGGLVGRSMGSSWVE